MLQTSDVFSWSLFRSPSSDKGAFPSPAPPCARAGQGCKWLRKSPLPSFLRLPVSSAAFPSVLHVATFREIEMRGKWSEMRPEDECWALKGPRRPSPAPAHPAAVKAAAFRPSAFLHKCHSPTAGAGGRGGRGRGAYFETIASGTTCLPRTRMDAALLYTSQE